MAVHERQTSGEAVGQSVAEHAYAIWESEGKPHGRDVDHWLRAEAELAGTADDDPPQEPLNSNKKTPARRK